MKFNLLQSGSCGNSALVESSTSKILIDVGLCKSTLLERLEQLNTSIDEIDGVLITHEHSDHIKGIEIFKDEKIYASLGTLSNKVNIIEPYKSFNINDINIIPIPTSHDVINPVGYIISVDKEVLVYLTDSGIVKEEVLPLINDADYYIIESNHNVEKLLNTSRPVWLKERILSNEGHLSNEQCGQILTKVIGPHTKKIVLAHLSEDANSIELAEKEVKEVLNNNNINIDNIEIVGASRKEITKGV